MEIIKINPFEQPAVVKAIASVYQQSFGGEPWNEGCLCPHCESVFASTPILDTCPKCIGQSKRVLMVEYWPMAKIISDFYREMRKSNPICIIAQSNEEIVGFAWGYEVSVSADLDDQLDAPGLHRSLHGDFFYLDECALMPSYQGKGIGKSLVKQIFLEQQQGRVLLRTMDNSRMCNLTKNMGGEIVQHIPRSRVIMQLLTL